MRFLRYLFLAAVAVLFVALALANREPVMLRLLQDELAGQFGLPAVLNAVTLPLFVVVLGSMVAGALLGYLAEYLREREYRVAARKGKRETQRLSGELAKAKKDSAQGDDVLALLEDAGSAR